MFRIVVLRLVLLKMTKGVPLFSLTEYPSIRLVVRCNRTCLILAELAKASPWIVGPL